MFTIEQVNEIHDKFGYAATLAAYLRELKAIGVEKSDSFIADGHTVHHGKNGYAIVTPPAHEVFVVSEASDRKKFLEQLELHSQQKTSYEDMSKSLADSGIEKWTFDTNNMTITYYNKAGEEMLTEFIE